jgi:hypothetical protein
MTGKLQAILNTTLGTSILEVPAPQLAATTLLLATSVPSSAWAGAAFNKTLKLHGII